MALSFGRSRSADSRDVSRPECSVREMWLGAAVALVNTCSVCLTLIVAACMFHAARSDVAAHQPGFRKGVLPNGSGD